jgi:methionine sulfoxide reductase catalytic subunit
MANIILRPDWHLPHSAVTPESVFLSRRRFLRDLGFAGAGLAALSTGLGRLSAAESKSATKLFPAKRNPEFNPGWTLTEEKTAATYNNFYEFSLGKDVFKYVDKFTTEPWKLEIGGLVENPMTIDAAELIAKFPLEERVYRFRCVEAWSMIVPWTGFPLSKVLEAAKPKSEAKFVRFVSFNKPEEAPGLKRYTQYPWPYNEGLRLDEAMNPLTLVASGIYGKALPKQHGAPLRIVVPWKYGYKSIKSIVKIELTATQPATLWETLQPEEYPFESNVDPKVPHPRWSQATERQIDTGDRVRTLPYNGYADQVAKLYSKA